MKNETDRKIESLKQELAALESKKKNNVWERVKGLNDEDLKPLGYMIHVRFHGDGEDD